MGPLDTVLDLGCSNAKFVLQAAEETGTEAYILGLDPDFEAYSFYKSNDLDTSRFSFMRGIGEDICLQDNSVKVTTAHNVLFRSSDMFKMLEEMKRVTEPGGLIILSTNARNHGYWRHYIEKQSAEATSLLPDVTIKSVQNPAATCYLEDLPEILRTSGGLEIIDDSAIQNSEAIITRGERYEMFKLAIQLTVPTEDEIPTRVLTDRRAIADKLVEDIVMASIERTEQLNKISGSKDEPYFADNVHRGLLVCRNIK